MTIYQEQKAIMQEQSIEEIRFNINKYFKPAELYIDEEKIAW